ncbi:hypothetical protein LAZ67_10000538 [Cordylochernes scorpioides]|uniref:RNA-directed DNA polymerase n=1 Tax=Cordylochernes scorpioides TaxID=51811 RepID=A0ABY6KVQ8_9ARAC|nr:hypothetical protein LAZ67_10000538 [Cordylochernes scorpioides]
MHQWPPILAKFQPHQQVQVTKRGSGTFLRQIRVDRNKNLKRMSKAKRQAGQKEAELAQENKSVIDALTAMMKSLGRDAPATAARFDGSSFAESFLRELERSPEFQNSSCDERSRMVVAALEGEPRRTLQSMDYLYEPYWRIKQVLEDLYPPPETPTHQEFYQLRCGPQGLQEYYLQKVRIGTQLNIERKEMVNALTQGMPSYSRNLLLIATPSSPSEWLTLARRIYGIGGDLSRPGISSPTESPSPRQSGRQTSNPLRRLSEDVPHSQKRPERSPSTPPTPCKHCQGPHWNNQCPQRSTLPGQLADHPRLATPPRYFRDPRDSATNRTLRKYERNYTITELECLAIIETVDRFKVYLAGNGFTIFTDHCALQWLKNIKNPTGRLFRWSLRLSVYDYQVKYIKGTKQLEADLLPRNPFCGLLDATQLKMYQSELRDNSKYVHQTSGLTTVTRRGVSNKVVPPSLRPTILREAHQKFNHPGISQLTRIISAQYFWSGMSIDIRAFVKNCNICQMSKTPKGPKYGELGELPESPLPFDLVSMDTIAGFARYGSAKKYLHVVVDHATRFAWTFPSRSTSTTTYIQVIKRVLQSGCPKRLLTDRAPAFTSPRFRRFLISHNIQPMLTTSNQPQANGLSERLNATLTGKLRLLHLQHPRSSWTMLQSKVVKAYNDTPHSVTGFPPSYLMDGSLPKELSQHLDPYPSVTESRRLALQRTKERHKIDKIRFDKNHRSPDFEVGDLVLTKIYQHPNTGKLVPYFSGPYEIIEVISPYTVRINRPNQAQNLETEIIHVNKLKHYSEDTKYIFTPHSTNNNSKPKSYFIYNHFPPEIFHDDYKNYASTLSNPFNHMNPDIFLDNVELTLTARYISTPDTIPKNAIRLEPSPTTKIILPSSPTRNHTPQISPQLRALFINCGNTKLENSLSFLRPVPFIFKTPSRVLVIPHCMLHFPLKRLRFKQSSPFSSNNKKFRNDIVTDGLSRQDQEMEINQDSIGVKTDDLTKKKGKKGGQEMTGREPTEPLAAAISQIAAALARGRYDTPGADLPIFDGTYSATQFSQTFDRKMEDASMGEQEKLLRLPNYLARQPLELFRKLRPADRSYFQVRQILLDLYPESSEASFAKYFAMKLTGQANLETYYREKTAMGLQLGLPQEVILETLTEGLPFSDQRLVRVVPPENLGEWFRLVQRIHGPSVPTTRPREDQPPTMSGPYHNPPRRPGAWHAPLPPSNCKFCGARHWHSEGRHRPVPATHIKATDIKASGQCKQSQNNQSRVPSNQVKPETPQQSRLFETEVGSLTQLTIKLFLALNIPCPFLIDTGASLNIVPYNLYHMLKTHLPKLTLKRHSLDLQTLDGFAKTMGKLSIPLTIGQISRRENFHVVNAPLPFGILSINSLHKFKLAIDFNKCTIFQLGAPLSTLAYHFNHVPNVCTYWQCQAMSQRIYPASQPSAYDNHCRDNSHTKHIGDHTSSHNYHMTNPHNELDTHTKTQQNPLPHTCYNTTHNPLYAPQFTTLLQRYTHIFTQNKFNVPCLRIPPVKIPTNSEKIITIRPYRVPICGQQEIRNQVQQMLENGIIEQSFSPFSSPVTLVTKRDKTKRFCIDYRKVNELISSDVHPLPRIEDILDRLAQAKYFSTADISSAYWQVPIHPDSRPLLAFATLEGLYQPTRLPFGLKTSPQIYERAISQVLQRHGLDCVAHYFDDFIIFSNTLEEHQNHLRQFFAFCEIEKLQLNFVKCEFFKQSIDFLGYTITAGTTTPLTRNTDIIHAIKQPHNRKTLQSFLGAVNVYNKFIPEYARLRAPLNNLLKKDVSELSHLSPLDIEQVLGIPEQGGLDNAPTVDDLTLSRILEAEFHFSSLEEKLDSFEADIIDILQQALQRHKTIPFFLQTEVELIKTNDASVAIENSDFEEVHPIATLSDGPIEFYIPGTFEHYIDPSFIFLQLAVKISKRDGSDIAATDKVGPINYLLNTAFENVEVFLNEKQIVPQNNYGYRSILDALLNFPENAQKTFLKSSLFEKDTAKYFDETDPNGNNLGLKARHAVMDLNKEITLFGAMNLDLSFQHKLLLNGVSLKIRLHRAKNSFVLISNTQGFVLKITKASLLVRKVTVSPSVVLAHNKTLENGVAKYPIRKVDVKTLTIPSGTHSTILPNLFLGPVPNRIVIGFVTNGAYSGDFTKNPFNFQNFNINYISLKIGQRVLPNRPLTPKFSEGEFYRSYIDLFSNMGRYLSSGELNITPEEFQNGLTLFAFDTTPDLCASDLHSSATQNSNISLEVKFSSALTSTINVILYSEFQSEIHIDKLRQVIHSCDQNALIKLNDGLYVPKSLPLKQNSYYDAEQRKITNVPEPTDDTDVVPKGFLTKKIKRLKKQVLLLDEENKHFDCNGYKVTNLGNAENDTDAITVLYLRDYLGKLVTSTETLDFRFMLMEGDSIALKCEFAQHKFILDGKIRKYRLRYENVPTACQKAFIDLKGNLTQHPILHLYKEGLPCQVYCDASTLGIAGILKQVHPDGNVYPVQFFSRTLRPHEKNYSISELECLAIVESVEKFRIYLMGRKFTIFSDHHALQWLKTIKNPSSRLFRWSLRLSSYEYEVRYIKGKQQYEADLLSRNPFCGFLDATLIKTHQPPPSRESSLTIGRNGLHTVSRKGVTKIIIPKPLIQQLLQTVHTQYNHPGISQMSRLISTQYYWQGMSKDIKLKVKTCSTCQLTKRPLGPTYGELSQPPEAKEPFDLLSLDTIAGFAKYGNTKIYLHVDGSPKRLLTDRAPAFTSPKFRSFLLNRNIHPLLTTSNNPQANGLCERLNATLTGKLRLLHLENPKIAWTKLVKSVTVIYNKTPHSTTGFPPIYLMFGILPPEISNHSPPYPDIDKARKIAHTRTQNKHLQDKNIYDQRHKQPHFEVGDLVLVKLYHHPNTGKLAPYFTGPHTVLEIISPNVVRIDRPNQPLQRDTDTIHVNKLKLYTETVRYISPPAVSICHIKHKPDYTFPFKHLTPELFPADPLRFKPTNSEPFRHLDPAIFATRRFAPFFPDIKNCEPDHHSNPIILSQKRYTPHPNDNKQCEIERPTMNKVRTNISESPFTAICIDTLSFI